MKENLKKKKRELLQKLKNNSKDSKFTDSLVDDLLLVDRQLNVAPTEVFIKSDKDSNVIETGAYRIVKTDGAIVFSFRDFKSVIYKGSGMAPSDTYTSLSYLFDIKDMLNAEEYTNDEISKEDLLELYDAMLVKFTLVMNYPSIILREPIMINATMDLLMRYMERLDQLTKEEASEVDSNDDISALFDVKEQEGFMKTLEKALQEIKLENK